MTTLADRYAAAKAAAEAATKELEALKKEIKALGQERLIGITCDVVFELREQRRLDTKAIEQFMTPDEIDLCKKPVLLEVLTVKAKGLVA